MPWSALPPHIDEPSEWVGSDWDNPWQRWLLKIKGWFAYGYRAKEWWARWRRYPVVLFALRGSGMWRIEWDDDDLDAPGYLSRVQYWCRWHVQLQWPLFFAFHVYLKNPAEPERYNRNTPLVYFYVGAHRDADGVYWFPSAFVGGGWK